MWLKMKIKFIALCLLSICAVNTRGELNDESLKSTKSEESVDEAKISDAAKMRQQLADKLDAQLVVTDDQRRQAQEISNQLSAAVTKNSYSNPKFIDPADSIKKFAKKSPSLLSSLLGTVQNPSPSDSNDNNVNVIESTVMSDFIEDIKTKKSDFQRKFVQDNEIWHSSLPNKDTVYREILQIESVREVLSFKLDENVKMWKTMPKSVDGKTILIGMLDDEIILVSEISNVFKVESRVQFEKSPKNFDVFLDQKTVEQQKTGYVVVILQTEVVFFILDEKYENISEHYRLNLHKPIVFLKYFQVDNAELLLLITKNSMDGDQYSSDIYEMDMNRKELWLIQVIVLPTACNHIATLDTGRDYILTFPQKNEVLIYNYRNNGNDKGKFVFHTAFPSKSVTYISGFSMGRYSYLAIGGLEPQILRYHRGELHPQSILSGSFGPVEQWFPIAARTHRDDMLLLVQHRVNFTTHGLSVIEALIWDGQAFNTVPHTPCYRGTFVSHFGMTCILDFEREFGIFGASIIQRGGNISILVPRDHEPSALFNLNIKLTPVLDPLREDVDELELTYGILSELLVEHDKMIDEMAYIITNGLDPDGDNIVTGDWEIDSLETPEIYLADDIEWTNNQISVGDKPFSKDDVKFDVVILKHYLQQNINNLDNLMNPPKIPRETIDADSPTQIVLPANGQFDINSLHFPVYHNRVERDAVESPPPPPKILHVFDLDVQNIEFEMVNDIPASELIFIDHGNLELPGTPTFDGEVSVGNVIFPENGGLVNGVSLKEVFIHVDDRRVVDNFTLDTIEVENNLNVAHLNGADVSGNKISQFIDLHDNSKIIANELIIDGNCVFKRINGIDFEQFLDKIVAKNLGRKIDDMTVLGQVTVDNYMNLDTLNGIAFPDEYLWSTGPTESIISGFKNFTQNLTTTAIDTDGTIDGIKPENVITLDGDEFIDGETTFRHLEVGTSLDLNGSIEGRHLGEFLKNPSLLQTNHVKSACVFKGLIVEGNIIVKNSFNGHSVDKILEDVVYRDQQDIIQLNSFKNFHEISVDEVHLTSRLLNGKEIDNFVTLDTDQTLNIRNIVGDVVFSDLQIGGLFDFLNVTEIDENSIKITGDQFTEAELICQGDDGDNNVIDVEANLLEIIGSINGRPTNDFHLNLNGVVIEHDIDVDDLKVEFLSAEQGVTGVSSINGVDLNLFDETRFSLSKSQTIEVPIQIKFCQISGDLAVDQINEVDMVNFMNSMNNFDSIPQKLLAGELEFDRITIEGSVHSKLINGHNVEHLKDKVVWLNRPNILKGEWRFFDEIKTRGDLTIDGYLNENVVENWMGDIVLRNETITVNSLKTFANGFEVDGDCNTEYLSGFNIKDILLKNQVNHVESITIYGNVQVFDLNTTSMNGVDMKAITSRYSYDDVSRSHVIRENVLFADPVSFSHLIADGPLNDIFNVNDLMSGIVQRNRTMQIGGRKTFRNSLTFHTNINVENLNGYNLRRELQDVVHIDREGPIDIDGNLVFNGPVIVPILKISGNLYGNNIAGSNPRDWVNNGLMINENFEVTVPLIFAPNTFRPSGLRVANINQKSMSKLIPLHSQQDLNNTTLIITDISTESQIVVGGNVNNMSLKFERSNTMMKYGDQNVVSPIQIKSLRVDELALLSNQINGNSLKDIVTIQRPNTTLTGSFNFQHIESPELFTDNLISGINFRQWLDKSLWRKGRASQTVTGDWKITRAHVANSILGSGQINNQTIHEIIEAREKKRAQILTELKEYAKHNYDICHDLQKLVILSHQSVYYMKYFESGFTLIGQKEHPISSTLFFKHNGNDFLLVNADCMTIIYRWMVEIGKFTTFIDFETGKCNQWVSLNMGDIVQLVSVGGDAEDNCKIKGNNVWQFDGVKISHVKKLSTELKIERVHTSTDDPSRFVVVHEGNTKITEFDAQARPSEEWVVPANGELRLLPRELYLGLAVADGRQISILTKNQNQRSRRYACESCVDDKFVDIGRKSFSLKAFDTTGPHTMDTENNLKQGNDVGKIHLKKQLKIGVKKWKKFVHNLKGNSKNLFRENNNPELGTVENVVNDPQVGHIGEEESVEDKILNIMDRIVNIGEKIVKYKKSDNDKSIEDYDRTLSSSQDRTLSSSLPTIPGTLFSNVQLNRSTNLPSTFGFTIAREKMKNDLEALKKKFEIGRKFNRKNNEMSSTTTTNENVVEEPALNPIDAPVRDDSVSGKFSKIKTDLENFNKNYGIGKKYQKKPIAWNSNSHPKQSEMSNKVNEMNGENVVTQTEDEQETTKSKPTDEVGGGTYGVSDIFPKLEDPMKKIVDTAIKFSADLDDFKKKMGIGKKHYKKPTEDEPIVDEGYEVGRGSTADEVTTTTTERSTDEVGGSPGVSEIFPKLEDPMKKIVDTAIKFSADLDDFKKKMGIGKKHYKKPAVYEPVVDEGYEVGRGSTADVDDNEVTTTTTERSTDEVGGSSGVSDIFPKLEDPMKKIVDTAIKFSADLDDFKTKMGIGKKHYKKPTDYEPVVDEGYEVGREDAPEDNANKVTTTSTENENSTDEVGKVPGVSDIFPKLEDPMKKLVDTAIKLSADLDDFNEKMGIGKKHHKNTNQYESDDDEYTGKTNSLEKTETTKTPYKYTIGSNVFGSIKKMDISQKVTKTDEDISMPLSPGNISITENVQIPEHGQGEMIVMQINFRGYQRTFVAISTTRESRIRGNDDLIYIYEDVLEGKLFQTLSVYRPSELVTIHLRDQTLLAYLEDNKSIQIYTYQGIEGFTHTNQIKLPAYGNGLATISVPSNYPLGCLRHYLMVTMMSGRLWFLEAIMEGDCGIDINLDCDNFSVY